MFGGWYDDPALLPPIGQMHALWERWAGNEGASVDQVALLVDPDSMLYVGGDASLVRGCLGLQRNALGRLGAPYAIYSTGDLEAVDWDAYRLVVVSNLFYGDDAMVARVRSTVAGGGRMVVWCHAPGILGADGWDPAGVERLTGVPWGTDGLAVCDMGGWTSVYTTNSHLGWETLRELAERAGVHLYGEGGEAVYATERLFASHSAVGGDRAFRLPCKAALVRELFTDRVVARETAQFTDRLPGPGTVLYALEP